MAGDPYPELSDLGARYEVPTRTILFRQDTACEAVYQILDGIAKLTRTDDDGVSVIVGFRFPGWLLGAVSLVLARPHPASVETLGPCEIRRVPAQLFREQLNACASFARRVHEMHCRELYEQVEMFGAIGARRTRLRLARLLVALADAQLGTRNLDDGKPIRLRVPLRRWDLAEAVGCTPEHVCRLLSDLEKGGVLRREKGWLVVVDFAKLRRGQPGPAVGPEAGRRLGGPPHHRLHVK
jgi:CRP/FNR family transcriptional regulator